MVSDVNDFILEYYFLFYTVLGIKFSREMYYVNEGSSNTLTLPVIRLRQYNKNISLAYTVDKMNNENSKLAQMLVGTAISGCCCKGSVNLRHCLSCIFLYQ